MSEEITKKLDENGDELPFDEFVRRQLLSLSSRITNIELNQAKLRKADKKVDIFVQEHLYLKRDVQDMQETLEQRH